MDSLTRKVLLLGASGSIGGQTIDIIKEAKDKFVLTSFSVGKNKQKAIELLKEFDSVKHIYITDENDAKEITQLFPKIKVFSGTKGLAKLTKKANYDMCVNALVGFAGFEPAVIALRKDKILCLANKEALVVGDDVKENIAKCFARISSSDVFGFTTS